MQHYSSAPTLTPSTVHISTPAKSGASPGDLLLAPYQGDGTPGPMITDQSGNLIWFHPLPAGDSSTSLKLAQYEGKPVLTWWQGRILEVGFGQGEDVIYNTSYQKVAAVRAGNGYSADLHEFRLSPEGTAWIDIFDPIDMNLSSFGGRSDGVLTDSVIEEVDVKTGLVMWQWHALGHIAIGESHNPAPKASYPWDYVHINSISPGGDGGSSQNGEVLLSSRNTWTLYDVDIDSGGVRWRLGGDHSSFKLGAGTRTYWQHDAEWQPGGLISVFDNGSDPPKEKQSRGLVLDPNLSNHTVTLAKQLTNPSKTLLASSQGDMLTLPGGNWMMGYGGLPNCTEYNNWGTCCWTERSARTCRTSGHISRLGAGSRLARHRLWPRPVQRDDQCLGELERGDAGRLLAGTRGCFREYARAGRRRSQDGGVSDNDLSAVYRPLRTGPGARLRRCRDRHLSGRSGTSDPRAGSPAGACAAACRSELSGGPSRADRAGDAHGSSRR